MVKHTVLHALSNVLREEMIVYTLLFQWFIVLFSILEANRTSRFLSGIINFIHFRESCLEKYEEFLLQNVRFKYIC